MKVKPFLFLLLLPAILSASCKKTPFDYRNKWIGAWHFEVTIYSYGDQSTSEYEEDGVVKYPDSKNDRSIVINGYELNVTKKGNLLYEKPHNGQQKVGTIDKETLEFSINTSVHGPGLQITMVGERID